MHLSLKWVPKFSFKFQLQESQKIESLKPLLHQPWIMTKITLNIMKVGVHCYLPNAQINLWSNFNSKKLVKSETRLYGFAEVGIKGVKYFGTSQNFVCTLVYQMGIQIYDQISIIRNCSGLHACLSNGHPNLWSSFNS